jgi:E3 ubiquitin-protein ligase RNF213
LTPQQSNIIIEVLSYSQNFMRKQKNECSFVSLRDVQRGLSVIEWFLKEGDLIFEEIKTNQLNNDGDGDEEIDEEFENTEIDEEFENTEIDEENFNNFNMSVILAMNVCYHACLQNNEVRKDYRIGLANCFGKNNKLDEVFILNVIDSCYEVFLNEIKLPDAIARNQALKENLFMMILCIELKIPLFLVGKPGK